MKKWIKNTTELDEKLQNALLYSLIDKKMDMMLLVESFDQTNPLTLTVLDNYFKEWSLGQLKVAKENYVFEDSLSIESQGKIEKKQLMIDFYLQWNEFDRNFFQEDKIKAYYPLEIKYSKLLWMRNIWKNRDVSDKDKIHSAKEKIAEQLEFPIRDLKRKIHPYISEDPLLDENILKGFLYFCEQSLEDLEMDKPSWKDPTLTVRLNFYFGVYALRAINKK